MSAALAQRCGQSGGGEAEKVPVAVSPEVVDWFRATGEGWQGRLDSALKERIAAHPRA